MSSPSHPSIAPTPEVPRGPRSPRWQPVLIMLFVFYILRRFYILRPREPRKESPLSGLANFYRQWNTCPSAHLFYARQPVLIHIHKPLHYPTSHTNANIKKNHQFVLLLEQIYIRFIFPARYSSVWFILNNKNYPHIAFQRPIQRDYRESHGGTKLAFPTQRTKDLYIENVL